MSRGEEFEGDSTAEATEPSRAGIETLSAEWAIRLGLSLCGMPPAFRLLID